MLSKSLIQFLFMGGLCSLPVVWPEAKYKGNGGNGNLLQKDLCQYASAPRTVGVSAPGPAAGHCRSMPPLETPAQLQASLAQSLVGLFLSKELENK